MRLHDTATGSVEELSPIDGETFRFYCCGPTVYGPAHIGNFRTFVLQDVLRRALEVKGLKTLHVRNLTDVDDKTIKGAIANNQSLFDYTEGWRKRFHADCEKLNCLPPHIEPSAVEHIPQQIEMIQSLIDKGNAYASEDGSVYFKISSFPNYGKLSKLDERELDLGKTQNARSNSDEYEKDGLADFVLWKSRKEEDGENFWESPWGQGRPGWHLECSAMIKEYLGDTFDLHSGGVDLVFPHHENEIAQSVCSCGGDFAKHWFHINHLMVDGGKMSKSLGNLYTIEDLEKEGFSANEVRYVLIGALYKRPLNFTFESLHAAKEALEKLSKARKAFTDEYGQFNETSEQESLGLSDFGMFQPAWEVLQYDLNTQAAIGKMFAQLKRLKGLSPSDALQTWKGWNALLFALGIEVPEQEEVVVDIPAEVQALAESRWTAKQEKDWAAADSLRDEITKLGWVMKDGKDGFHLEKV